MFNAISSMQRVSVRSRRPWNLLAVLLVEGLKIKNRERTNPRKTPRKINTEKASMLMVVFIENKYKYYPAVSLKKFNEFMNIKNLMINTR